NITRDSFLKASTDFASSIGLLERNFDDIEIAHVAIEQLNENVSREILEQAWLRTSLSIPYSLFRISAEVTGSFDFNSSDGSAIPEEDQVAILVTTQNASWHT
ncbi:MAG TPA: hypothetical protein VE641_18010, partial [Chthoniobacterales bacterium]|nr:hypothetical protein [Chthoniobacterales bacterium]